MARLTQHVHVEHEGTLYVFGPDDALPAWADAAITNPDVWDEEHAGPADVPPPKTGRGATAQAWARYAEHHGVPVAPGAGRDDIIAAVAAAGVATE